MAGRADDPGGERGPEATPSPEIEDFEILRELGHGGMAVVYLARQQSLRRLVALKVLPPRTVPSPKAVARFGREATAAAKLHHPHIVPVFTVGAAGETRYIAMEYVQGATLDRLIASLREAPPDRLTPDSMPRSLTRFTAHLEDLAGTEPATDTERPTDERRSDTGKRSAHATIRAWDRSHIDTACRISAEVAEALQHAHEHRIYHRDVKPANILVDRDGRAMLMDFGLAHEEGALSLTQTGEFTGTPLYIAPEQIDPRRLEVDHRCDIYSLGVTLYELVTLHTPYVGRTAPEIFRKVLTRTPIPPRRLNPQVSRDLETIILKAMEKEPDDRYATAAEMAEDLRRHLALLPITGRRAGLVRRATNAVRRHRLYAASLITLVAVVLFLLAMLAHSTLRARAAEVDRDAQLAETIGRIEEALARHDTQDAGAGIATLRMLAPEDARLDPLERRRFEEEAARARDEGENALALYHGLLDRIHGLEEQVERDRATRETTWVPPERRRALHQTEREIFEIRSRAENTFWAAIRRLNACRELLVRAGQASRSVDELVARLYLARYEEAVRRGESQLAGALRGEIIDLDLERRLRSELRGLGEVSLHGTPAGASIWLFRYLPREPTTTTGPGERLVPVPVDRSGQPCSLTETGGFQPGDLCLIVRDVDTASPLGVRVVPGDLVIALQGEALRDQLYVSEVRDGGPAARAGVRPGMRLEWIDGHEAPSAALLERMAPPVGYFHQARFASSSTSIEVVAAPGGPRPQALGVTLVNAGELLAGQRFAGPLEITVLHDGAASTVTLPPGRPAGLTSDFTAYPLITGESNRIGSLDLERLELPPGSYLAVISASGFESQRLPFHLPRRGRVALQIRLLEAGTTPPGFLWVPAGPFVYGGDHQAYRAAAREETESDGFWIQRCEVTYGAWHAFLSEPEARRQIDRARRNGRTILLPRTPLAPEGIDLRTETGELIPAFPLDHPVVYVSYDDIRIYVAWLNRRLEQEGAHYRVDLPSEREWERAARGADERIYPWGDLFDPGLCCSLYARPMGLRYEPVASYPWDQSPFGVRDMAGSVREWLRTRSREEPVILCRGGSMAEPSATDFRIGNRFGAIPEAAPGYMGFRLVAHKIDG